MVSAYLLLGSNIGNRENYLRRARLAIAKWAKTRIIKFSSIHETAPWGVSQQRHFLNQAVKIKTALEPMALLLWAKKTELELGRQRRRRWGPREIDIDILLYGRQIIRSPYLQIPHPRLAERVFVLLVLNKLAPKGLICWFRRWILCSDQKDRAALTLCNL